ncbi:MAG: fumarylacetoacetate hydrolase family protein [Pseudomonadota bacterium]
MSYVFEPAIRPAIAVAGSDAMFPVRRIFCVGRNYRDHVREMGADADRDPPFFFTKPADAVVATGSAIPFPSLTQDLHHEIELVVAIGKAGAAVAVDDAEALIFGYATGIDLTRRDLQLAARHAGLPWDMGKGFDLSAPCAPIHRIAETGPIDFGPIWLRVDEEMRQQADIADLIWPVPDLLARLSQAVELQPGDLVYTGTPAGVGSVRAGQRLRGGVAGLTEIDVTIAAD